MLSDQQLQLWGCEVYGGTSHAHPEPEKNETPDKCQQKQRACDLSLGETHAGIIAEDWLILLR
jgi:hypothetical protein